MLDQITCHVLFQHFTCAGITHHSSSGAIPTLKTVGSAGAILCHVISGAIPTLHVGSDYLPCAIQTLLMCYSNTKSVRIAHEKC